MTDKRTGCTQVSLLAPAARKDRTPSWPLLHTRTGLPAGPCCTQGQDSQLAPAAHNKDSCPSWSPKLPFDTGFAPSSFLTRHTHTARGTRARRMQTAARPAVSQPVPLTVTARHKWKTKRTGHSKPVCPSRKASGWYAGRQIVSVLAPLFLQNFSFMERFFLSSKCPSYYSWNIKTALISLCRIILVVTV